METDYRFMPEANLLPVHIKHEWIENCRSSLSKPRYWTNIEKYGMDPDDALQIAVSYYSIYALKKCSKSFLISKDYN